MSAGQTEPGASAVELLNPNARVTELLENMGVLHLFKLTQGPLVLPEGTEARPYPCANPSREEVTPACIEAHQTFITLNPANVPRFQPFTHFLALYLKTLTPPHTH